MNQGQFKYDLAFSFLAADESFASNLNDLVQDRLSTFLYTKRQENIAGTDGEQSFNAVFSEQARAVVVLYRKGWGESPWTRIEETAIRNRAYSEGYDFVTFIPLDEPPSVPNWLPKTRLWVGLKRWGLSGAASAIEARIQELGGVPREESVEDRAKRLERASQFKRDRDSFVYSSDGVIAANAEYEVLIAELERLLVSIKKVASSISYVLKKASRQAALIGGPSGLSIDWICHYANSLDKAKLEISIWTGHPPFPGTWHIIEEPRCKKKMSFQFDLLKTSNPGWVLTDHDKREFDTKELAAYILKYYMDDAGRAVGQ